MRKLAQTAKGAVKTLGRAAKTLAPAVGLAYGGGMLAKHLYAAEAKQHGIGHLLLVI